MKLLIDNTGIQSIGMCLQGKPRNENDVRNLIQLGTLLVFSNELVVNSIGITAVTHESQKVIDHLSKIGIEREIIKQGGDEKLFWLACEQAAEDASDEIFSIISSSGNTSVLSTGISTDVFPVRYSGKDIQRTWDLFIRVGGNSISKEELLEKKESSKSFYTAGATDYMLAHSEKLQRLIRMIMKEKKGEDWEKKDIFHLQVFLRAYLNNIIARNQGAYYSPSVTKAQYIRQDSKAIMERLQETMNDPVSEFRELHCKPLNIPSVVSVLLCNSEGKPEKFIEEALKLREKTVAIRKEASQWLSDCNNDFDGLISTSNKLSELSSILRIELGLEKSPKLVDAIEMQVNLVVPTCKFNLGKIRDWTRYIQNKKKYVVLTEMSKSAAFIASADVERAYRKLCCYL